MANLAAAGSPGSGTSAWSKCPGCGLSLPDHEGPPHPYLGCSAACWALYGEVLARQYGDPAYSAVHQLTVDAYAAQHPGVAERRTIQSLALHLITLCLVLEQGADPLAGPRLHKRLAAAGGFRWLELRRPIGRVTVAAVHRAGSVEEHEASVRRWARDVWTAWEPHHSTVRRWIEERLGAAEGSAGPAA